MPRKNLLDSRVVSTHPSVNHWSIVPYAREMNSVGSGSSKFDGSSLTKVRVSEVLVQTSFEIPMPDKKTGPQSGPVCFCSSPRFYESVVRSRSTGVRLRRWVLSTGGRSKAKRQNDRFAVFRFLSWISSGFVDLQPNDEWNRQCECIIVFVKKEDWIDYCKEGIGIFTNRLKG